MVKRENSRETPVFRSGLEEREEIEEEKGFRRERVRRADFRQYFCVCKSFIIDKSYPSTRADVRRV